MKQNQNKVIVAKTAEDIKYKPILSQLVLWFHLQGLITLENQNLKIVQKFVTMWTNLIL